MWITENKCFCDLNSLISCWLRNLCHFICLYFPYAHSTQPHPNPVNYCTESERLVRHCVCMWFFFFFFFLCYSFFYISSVEFCVWHFRQGALTYITLFSSLSMAFGNFASTRWYVVEYYYWHCWCCCCHRCFASNENPPRISQYAGDYHLVDSAYYCIVAVA